MVRLFAAVLSVLTMLGLGIAALQFRQEELDATGLSGPDLAAYNLTTNVSSDTAVILGNALPRLLLVVIFVFIIFLVITTR